MLNGVLKYKLLIYKPTQKMTCVMCNPWKKTFTLVPLAPLTVISPNYLSLELQYHDNFFNLMEIYLFLKL
jgi:hypothetical protein